MISCMIQKDFGHLSAPLPGLLLSYFSFLCLSVTSLVDSLCIFILISSICYYAVRFYYLPYDFMNNDSLHS